MRDGIPTSWTIGGPWRYDWEELGVVFVAGALRASLVEILRGKIDLIYGQWEKQVQSNDLEMEVAKAGFPPGFRWLPQVSSMNLNAAIGLPLMRALLAELNLGQARAILDVVLNGAPLVNLDQSWLRKQYAPHRYPPQHGPHGWHQDGALGFDFLSLGSDAPPAGAILPLVTCWIALTPCGINAPGLEFVTRSIHELFPVAALSDEVLRARFPAQAFWRPEMQPGDAVLFPGSTLHRTHVTPSMTEDRTSVELRFAGKDNIPARLTNDCWVPTLAHS